MSSNPWPERLQWVALAVAIVGALGMAASPALAQQKSKDTPLDKPSGKQVQAPVMDRQGQPIGTVVLIDTPDGVLVRTDIRGLPPGEHAFHIHEKGACDAADGFTSAGGHFNPEGHGHGYMNGKGHHAGDMPNQRVPASGHLQSEVFNPDVRLTSQSLLDADGAAVVLHAKADDYQSQPAGDAGDRIACAVIR